MTASSCQGDWSPSAPYLAKPDLAATSSRARFAVAAQAQTVSFCRRIANWNGQVQSGPGDRCSSARLQGLVARIFPEFPDNSQVGSPLG